MKCKYCNGDGWTIEHHSQCGSGGHECTCGGEQVQCEHCKGTGNAD